MYFKEVGAPAIKSADIGQLDFFKALDAALLPCRLPIGRPICAGIWFTQRRRRFRDKFVQENFNFYGTTLTGAKEMLPRWKRCVQATDRELGEALGQYYVQRYFPPEAKASALAMVKNLIAALHDDLTTLDWMSPATRAEGHREARADHS